MMIMALAESPLWWHMHSVRVQRHYIAPVKDMKTLINTCTMPSLNPHLLSV